MSYERHLAFAVPPVLYFHTPCQVMNLINFFWQLHLTYPQAASERRMQTLYRNSTQLKMRYAFKSPCSWKDIKTWRVSSPDEEEVGSYC